jgi:hypothetical protein
MLFFDVESRNNEVVFETSYENSDDSKSHVALPRLESSECMLATVEDDMLSKF